MHAQDIIDGLNEVREKLNLAPLGETATPAESIEIPITIKKFIQEQPHAFASEAAARWHLSKRAVNGMDALGAVVERGVGERKSILVRRKPLIRWLNGER